MSESGDTLAAEFVLGTLDGLERAQARVLLGTDRRSPPMCASGSAGSTSSI